MVWYFSQHLAEFGKEVRHLPAGFNLGYFRGRSFPPKNAQLPPPHQKKYCYHYSTDISNYISEKSSRRDEVRAHIVTFLEIVSQNVPDCISGHIHYIQFPGEHVPGPAEEARRLRPLGTSPPNNKS